jgi:ABC-type branched-subunit amino acid transport system ATPase component
MQPLALTLKGFRGIREGLGFDQIALDLEHLAEGAELIAIAGANGSGKTTVMDNLHPLCWLRRVHLGACQRGHSVNCELPNPRCLGHRSISCSR